MGKAHSKSIISTNDKAIDDKDSRNPPRHKKYEYDPEDFPWVWAIRDTSVLDWQKGLNTQEIMEQNRIQDDLPIHIYGNVLLGNALSVTDIGKLNRLVIKRVLNMAGPLAIKKSIVQAYKKENIDYKVITAQDEDDYPLLENHWKSAYEYIHAEDSNCVVHCVAGINRSVLIVAADHMVSCKIPVLKAMKLIRKQRGNLALCNTYFQEQLVSFARQHDLLGDKPGTKGSFLADVSIPKPETYPLTIPKKDVKTLFSGI